MNSARMIKKVSAAALSLLLSLQAAMAGAALQTQGQTLGRAKRQEKHRRPKLAPDLLAGLARMEEDEAEAERSGRTLAA
jgi:hypothetical protein